jgi:PAS domain S-box-containing protein
MVERASLLKHTTILWSAGLLIGVMLAFALPPTPARVLLAVIATGSVIGLVYASRRVNFTQLGSQQFLYHALFEQNSDAVFWIDFQGKVLRVNQRACDLLGYPMGEFPSLRMSDIVVETEVAHAEMSLQKLLAGERLPVYERTMRRKDGAIRHVEINIQMVYDSKGSPVCIQSVMRDITERKHSQQLLVDSEKRLRTLIGALPDRTVIFDVHGRYRAVLKGEYETDSPLDDDSQLREGHFIHEYYSAAFADFCLEQIRQTLQLNSPQVYEYPCPLRGETFRFEARVIPYRDPQSGEPLVFWVIRDITERMLGEQRRLQLTLEKEKLNVLREFVNGIAHDLKTPLTVIRTSLHLLQRYEDTSRRQEKIQVMNRQIDLVTQMLDDMLAVVRLDVVPQLQIEALDLASLMQEIVDDLCFKAEEKEVHLQFHSAESPLMVEASKDELRRALSNLVDNAVKYTPQGGAVDVNTYLDDPYFHVEIRDTGIGINTDEIARVFDRFFRGNNARSIASGTGLGLAITKRIIDVHGGNISVESEINRGSTFHVRLPQHGEAPTTVEN